MGIGYFLLGSLIAIFFCLFMLLLLGVIYFEFTNSEIPPGLAQPGKLRVIHCTVIGMAVLGKIVENFGICSQAAFHRYIRERLVPKKMAEDSKLFIKDVLFEEVPVRIYQPKSPSAGGRKGVLFFHGGGWMFGSLGDEPMKSTASKRLLERVVLYNPPP